MFKTLTKRLLLTVGLKINRVPSHQQKITEREPQLKAETIAKFMMRLKKHPLNANEHLDYANYLFEINRNFLAYAEFKTAKYLGAVINEDKLFEEKLRDAIPEHKNIPHNQYFRFKTLCNELILRAENKNISVLDVGGSEGQLASFLPEATHYCLAEPTTNCISGTDLPFEDKSFDYVVACHVLEHIPVERRTLFLNQLMSKAKNGVILLNPFHIDGTFVRERLELFIEITNAEWAKEHLECSLPKLDDIKAFAVAQNIDISMKPSGTLTTGLAFAFLDHFSGKADLRDDRDKVSAFFNNNYFDISDSDEYPIAYLVYLKCKK
ncbi:class I SAM-dependent methyltransferase [Psychromonas sp. L1A2]|uniref:class I SAM-dependent methyltransferase n=1 Tax=Psychromonas sp. L1A2 TaxID=2686356 RepID=UPI00135BDA49|nr:class I SAM-dependent methyltransferase [Psychromonas sp. L1A2]